MENMVDVANDMPQADIAGNVVDASELMAPLETVEEPLQAEGEPQADVAEKTYTKAEVDAEIRKKADFISRGYEKKLQSDPRIALAEFLMNQTGEKDTVKAADRVRMEYIEKQAEALSQDPLVLAQMLLEMRAPAFKPEVNAEAVDEDGVRIAQQVIDCIENEELPSDFNPIDFDRENPGFLQYAAKRGVSSAFVKFNKPKENTPPLPRPTRPSAPVPDQRRDYLSMTDKEFREIEARIKAAASQGRKVIL